MVRIDFYHPDPKPLLKASLRYEKNFAKKIFG